VEREVAGARGCRTIETEDTCTTVGDPDIACITILIAPSSPLSSDAAFGHAARKRPDREKPVEVAR
jgi:hypothetical protein